MLFLKLLFRKTNYIKFMCELILQSWIWFKSPFPTSTNIQNLQHWLMNLFSLIFIAYIKYVCFGWSYPADPCKYATSERCVTQLPAASFSFNTHLVKGLFLWMSTRRKVLATTGTPLFLSRRHCSSKVLLLSQVHRFLSHPNQKHCCSLKHLHLPLLAHFFFTFSRLISFSGRLRLWKLHSLI